jgi:aminoglycoside 3-N-acetyltransferase
MASEKTAKKTPLWKDGLLVGAELAAKQVYWRMPWARRLARRILSKSKPSAQSADHQEFKEYLRRIGVVEGALVMAHTSTFGLTFTEKTEAAGAASNAISTASRLVDDLMECVGPTGTLVMPTHAIYQTADNYGLDAPADKLIHYNPATTPCGVGLANELFRRRKGVQRSLHPFNMVAALGPLAEELLRDNLNDLKPLPHGIHSPYYRICQKNGLVVSIGVPLGDCMTLIHAAEDARDAEWPIKDFFAEKRYLVRIEGRDREVVVRQQREEYTMYCRCRFKSIRDLVGEGIIHEGSVGTVRVDWARSGEVFDYLMSRNQRRPYPFYCTWLVRKKR